MSAQAIYVFLLAFPFLHLLNAQYVLRGQAPPLTVPLVFVRQIHTCPTDHTSCTDGGGGCCEIGAPCAFSNGIPICNATCGLGPICTSDLDSLCCNLGFTCNYQTTLCISTTAEPTMTLMSLTPLPPLVTLPPSTTPKPPPQSTLQTGQSTLQTGQSTLQTGQSTLQTGQSTLQTGQSTATLSPPTAAPGPIQGNILNKIPKRHAHH
jgi:hypothetical protein